MKALQKSNYLTFSIVIFCYLLIFIYYTFPLISNFTDGIISTVGHHTDANEFTWNAYTFKKLLLSGQNPFHTSTIYHPVSTSLVLHTYTPIIGILNLGFDNVYLSVNVALLVSFVLSGFGAFLLARRFLKSDILSFIAGFIFAYCPYKAGHLYEGHVNLMLTATIPFFAMWFLDAFEFNYSNKHPKIISWKKLILCFVIGVVAFLSDYIATFFMIFIGAFSFIGFYWLRVWREASLKKRLIMLTVVFLCGHLAARYFLAIEHVDNRMAFWWQGDVSGLLTPYLNSSLYGNIYDHRTFPDWYSIPYSCENAYFVGWIFFIVVIWALFTKKRLRDQHHLTLFAFLSIVFLMMTFPSTKVGGKMLIHPPTSLLHFVPFLNHMRIPSRYILVVMLYLPIVVFYILENRYSLINRVTKYAAYALLFVLIFIEYSPTNFNVRTREEVPVIYDKLAKMDDGVLLPLPFGYQDGEISFGKFNLDDLHYQIIHNKPIMGGYISRMPKNVSDYYQADSVAAILEDYSRTMEWEVGSFDKWDVPGFTAKNDVKYIMVSDKLNQAAFVGDLKEALGEKVINTTVIDDFMLLELSD